MIDKFFKLLYDVTLISIVHTKEEIQIYIEIYYKEKLKASDSKSFTLNHSFKKELLDNYINTFIKDTPYHYIALLDTSKEQGIIKDCSEYHKTIRIEDPKVVCHKGKWGFYTSTYDLHQQQKEYRPLEIDFIFSPFALLYNFFQDKIDNDLTMYLLVQEDSIALAVFKHSELLYGDFIDTTIKYEEDLELEAMHEEDEIEEDDIDSINLDDIGIEDDLDSIDDGLDELDNLDNLEELDSLDSLDDAHDLEEQLEENLEEMNHTEEADEDGNLQSTQDFHRFTLIQKSLKKFYDDPSYESDFIEHIYVADSIHLSYDFKKYIQEELFANVFVRKVDLVMEVNALAKKELDL